MEPIDDVPNPHDSLFRRVLGEPANAAAELRAVLPAAVAARIAWDRLALQSRVDPLMAYRLLRYIVRIWDRWLRDNPLARKLPAVIPIVLHHDRRAWTAPTQLLDLIDLDRPQRRPS